jgi:Amt family ammonium transporter
MDTVGHNKIAINFVWTLMAGFLVMFMQAGFAMVETASPGPRTPPTP